MVTPEAGAEAGNLLDQVSAEGLLGPGRPVLVLLSGGRDSTCLLGLAVHICGADSVSALHVNYGMRDSAERDQSHCAELCRRLGVRLQIRRPEHPHAGNLQAWAREERYTAAAAELAAGRGTDVAVGHTATDQVETILYRLASSPSRRALLGMKPRDGAVIRPLLRYTRAQTAAWCAEQGLEWCEDDTNDSDVFARGRIRSELVPAFRTIHPGAERHADGNRKSLAQRTGGGFDAGKQMHIRV